MLLRYLYDMVNHEDTVTLQNESMMFVESDQYFEDGTFPGDILDNYVVIGIEAMKYELLFTVKKVGK